MAGGGAAGVPPRPWVGGGRSRSAWRKPRCCAGWKEDAMRQEEDNAGKKGSHGTLTRATGPIVNQVVVLHKISQ
jgi:hypothetical protein